MEYKNYYGSVEYSDEDEVFFGKILFINDVVTFEGECVKDLKEAFHYMVDDYILTCEKIGKKPNKPFSGSFNVRTGSLLHQKLALLSEIKGVSLNKAVIEALEEYINKENTSPITLKSKETKIPAKTVRAFSASKKFKELAS